MPKRRTASTSILGITPRQRAVRRALGYWALSIILAFACGWFVQASAMAGLVADMCGAG